VALTRSIGVRGTSPVSYMAVIAPASKVLQNLRFPTGAREVRIYVGKSENIANLDYVSAREAT